MSKLKEHLFCECDECIREYRGPLSNEMRPYYLKSEADKVIAELKDKALQYKVLDKEHCRDLNTQERFFALQIAHHKYKRCLAMWLYLRECYWRCKHHNEKTRADWYEKWMDIFKKIAEHYKAAK